MPAPSKEDLFRPLLEIASETRESLSTATYLEIITDRLSLTQEDLRETVPSGMSRLENNVRWGIFDLRAAKLLDTPVRGRYRISAAGRDYFDDHIGPITTAQLKKLAQCKKPPPPGPDCKEGDDNARSPQCRIYGGYSELQEQLANDLLDSISRISPDGFERLVVDLLEKMGYGKGEAVGRSGDEGIDGIIDQDALGLEKVYIQAKRWQSQVGEPDIRNFAGSLDAKGASKGVFVTTSSFSETAKQTANTISAGTKLIRLIDGPELAKLMLDHDVGVITQYTYKIQKLDENYFSEES